MVAAQQEEQRVESIKGIIHVISKPDPEKKKDSIRTRTNAKMESAPNVRKAIEITRVKVGTQVPDEYNQSDTANITEVCLGWPKEEHQMLLECLAGVFKGLNMGIPDTMVMIQRIQKKRKEMKKPWWKFWHAHGQLRKHFWVLFSLALLLVSLWQIEIIWIAMQNGWSYGLPFGFATSNYWLAHDFWFIFIVVAWLITVKASWNRKKNYGSSASESGYVLCVYA